MILGAYERKIVSVNEGIQGGPVNSLFQESLYTRDFYHRSTCDGHL